MSHNDGSHWNEVDWGLQDTVIAHSLGLSRERVRQVRKELGKPPSPAHNRQKFKTPLPEDAEKYTARELAKRIDCSLGHAYRLAEQSGIKLRPAQRGKMKYPWHEVDWSLSTKEIAKQLGIITNYVSRARAKYAPSTLEPRVSRAKVDRRTRSGRDSDAG